MSNKPWNEKDEDWLIEHEDVYEIKDYEPVIAYDDENNEVSVINCPYIPKFFIDRSRVSAFDRANEVIEEPKFDFNAKKHHDVVNKIIEDIHKEIEEEQNGTQKETR